MLAQDFEEMSSRVESVKPEFERLSEIRDRFRDDIRSLRDQKARSVADSFKQYIIGLENSFEAEFPRYQPPELGILDALNRGRQEEFRQALEKAFQQYLNDKFYAWSITAEKDLGDAFKELSRKAEYYGTSYQTVTDQINEKLTGKTFSFRTYMPQDQDSTPGWAKWAMGLFSLASGNVAGIALAAAGFDFTSILFNFFTASFIAVLVSGLFGFMFLPVVAVVGLGLGALQASDARAKINQAIKQELVKHLPNVAQEQWHPIYTAVQECFDSYEKEAMARIDDDIQSRQTELENLLKRKQEQEINLNVERERLENLSQKVVVACEAIESSYQELLKQV
jgi:Skp family chaperone for outer membrane proteins